MALFSNSASLMTEQQLPDDHKPSSLLEQADLVVLDNGKDLFQARTCNDSAV
jgi:hypothetical protein